MIIREQGRQVQLIRSPYQKDLKRCTQHVFMHFLRCNSYDSSNLSDYLTPSQIQELTPTEQTKLTDWFTTKKLSGKRLVSATALSCAAINLGHAADGVLADTDFLNESTSQAIYAAMAELQKRLRKKGYPSLNSPLKREKELRSPMTYSARGVQYHGTLPGPKNNKYAAHLYSVEIKAQRKGLETSFVFDSVLFLEQCGLASICGVEQEDGRPVGYLVEACALKQQYFIQFLRGEARTLSSGQAQEGEQEKAATVAYLLAREQEDLDISIGQKNSTTKEYETVEVLNYELARFFENARSIPFWDDL